MERGTGRRNKEGEPKEKPIVGIIMGSDSDLPVMQEAAIILEELKIPYEIRFVSAHRTPELMSEYAITAEERGIKVIIAGAGGAAELPGGTASETNLPVIGVPIKTSNLNGIDSLLSIVQQEDGNPVGTMAINGARNAGIFAAEILANLDPELAERLLKFKREQNEMIRGKNERLGQIGFRDYLEEMGR